MAAALAGAAVLVAMPTTVDAAPHPTAPAAPAAANRLIVGYAAGAPEASSLPAATADARDKLARTNVRGSVVRRLSTGGVLVDLGAKPTAAALAAVTALYLADPTVASVEPDLTMRAMTNDQHWPKQWDLMATGGGMNVDAAWAQSTGAGVTVAVLDTGLVVHSDLSGRAVAGYDFVSSIVSAGDGGGRDADPADPGNGWRNGECPGQTPTTSSWHGTHVTGTIVARANNDIGIAGVAHGATVQPVRVLGKCGGSTSDIADAIVWASGGAVTGVPANTTPAQVINLSLGGRSLCGPTYQRAIDLAVARGTTVVAAAGNAAVDVVGYSPANCNNVIAVAATNVGRHRASYSNYGARVDIAAPGGETRGGLAGGIYSTINAGRYTPTAETYGSYQGTSMAAPHVAGLVALMESVRPDLTPARIEQVIKLEAGPIGTCTGGCGAGIADAAATVATVVTLPPPGPCDLLGTIRSGTLTAGGTAELAPFTLPTSGTISACLTGPADADLDLLLQRKSTRGWTDVPTSSVNDTSVEQLTHAAARGSYRFRVVTRLGAGPYTVMSAP